MNLKIYLSIFISLLFLFQITAMSQEYRWVVAFPHLPEAARYDDISFISPKVGWAVNSSGQIYKTTNSGENWTMQLQASVYFRSIKFANTLDGWAGTVNGNNLLYHTTDGGTNWNLVTNIPTFSGGSLKICGLAIVNENIIYGSGAFNGPAVVIKTTDGGDNWQLIDMKEYATNLVDCYFINKDSGFVVGGSPNAIFDPYSGTTRMVILFTSDGGETWVNRFTSDTTPEWGWKIVFPTPEIGYVSVENFFEASVIKTVDAGVTWKKYPVNVTDMTDLEGIGFINATTGWVAARENELFTTDGGKNWRPFKIGAQINRFQFFGDSLGYAAGRTIYKYTKQPTTVVKNNYIPLQSFFLSQNYPNPFNPSTTIEYTLPEPGRVLVRIYDGLGQVFRTILDTDQSAGQHSVVWDGKDANGNSVSSGHYIYRIDSGNNAESKMMILLK